MKVKIKRFKEGKYFLEEYELHVSKGATVLEILCKIKEEKDPTLSFRIMCRSSICGTCAVKINGEHRLACSTRAEGKELLIEPVDNLPNIKDLVVSHDELFKDFKKAKAWIFAFDKNQPLKAADLAGVERPRDCILCGICNSVCPPISEGKNFGGPLIFNKLYSLLKDPRDKKKERLKDIADLNIQQCVHCGNCNLFCPKGCMPEKWITLMETQLKQKGFLQKEKQDFGFLEF